MNKSKKESIQIVRELILEFVEETVTEAKTPHIDHHPNYLEKLDKMLNLLSTVSACPDDSC